MRKQQPDEGIVNWRDVEKKIYGTERKGKSASEYAKIWNVSKAGARLRLMKLVDLNLATKTRHPSRTGQPSDYYEIILPR